MESQVFWKGGSKSTSTSTSTPAQTAQNKTLLAGADKWLGTGFDKNYGGSENFDSAANLTQSQQAGITGMQNTGSTLSDIYNGLGVSSVADYLGPYDPNKTGLTSALQAANEQSQFDFETGQMGNIRQGATEAGQFGSSRAGIAEGLARGRLAQGQAATAANMAYQDQQAYNTNRLNTLNNLTGITKGLSSGSGLQYDAGALDQQQQQKEIQSQLEQWGYENNVNLNDLLAYKQLISGDMGGTNTTTQKGGGGGSGLGSALGSVGGFALGNMIAPGVGGMVGAQAGGPLGAGILNG
jgi:hypothetical protein